MVKFLTTFRRANDVLAVQTQMFEKYLNRMEPRDPGTGLSSHASTPGVGMRDDRGMARKRSKSRGSNLDRSLKLTAEQKCDIAQREIEELREDIDKLKEDSEKVLDTYKVNFRSKLSVSIHSGLFFCFLCKNG